VLTFEDVRAYQLHLVSRGLEATTINQVMCAARFLYGTTLGKKDASEEIKLARQFDPLPVVLSRDEVARFLKAVLDLRWRNAAVTIYAAGLRVSEAVALTIKDIDSARMVIHIRQAKGQLCDQQHRRPLLCSMRITMRLLSMSPIFSATTSETRNPAP
jgi:site-specific recombinase XerD